MFVFFSSEAGLGIQQHMLLILLIVGVGKHREGTANDGDFQNVSVLLQGAVLMVWCI